MKQFQRHFILSLIFAFGLLIVGCDKEESPASSSTQKPSSPKVSFDGPNTQSTNTYAQQAKVFSQMFNGFALQFSTLAEMPGGTQNGNVWTYTYTVQGFTETITVELLGDGSYKWKIIFNGTEPGGSITYVNWIAFEGTSSADGKSGSWKFYGENTTVLEAEISWSTDAQGNETGILKTYTNGVLQEKLDIVNNVNGTGSMKLYDKKTATTDLYLSIDISWIADGTGTYTVYNEAGTVTASGTF
ncbi:MAG: hypothetical protein Q8L88_11975 [Bacteroidota bacterium]|nr:hypothetical protein [Bacteroidota bacterium]